MLSQLGRFTQADTIIPEQSQGTQAWDRYAYVNNSPVRYSDPTGHIRVEDPGSTRGCSDPNYCQKGSGDTNGDPEIIEDDDPPSCPPQLPDCNPLYSRKIPETELSTLETYLINAKSTASTIGTVLGVASLLILLYGGLTVNPVALVVGTGLGIASLVILNESTQLGDLTTEIADMKNVAASSPDKSVQMYVFTHPELSSPAPSSTYEGSDHTYTASSILTAVTLSSNFFRK